MTRLISTTEKTAADPDMQKVIDLWENGKDSFDIAMIMNVHESAIYNCLSCIRGIPTEPYAYPLDAAQDRFFSKDGWR